MARCVASQAAICTCAAEAGVDDGRAGALGAEHVDAEDAGQVGMELQDRGGLLDRGVLDVEAVLLADDLDAGELTEPSRKPLLRSETELTSALVFWM